MIRTEGTIAEIADRSTGGACGAITFTAIENPPDPGLTGGTGAEAGLAVGQTLYVVDLIETGPHYRFTAGTDNQTIVTETLPTCTAGTDMGAVLPTSGTAHRAFRAD